MINSSYHILLIHSIPDQQKMLLELLKSNGFFVSVVNNGREAKQLALKSSFNLLICQDKLSDETGFQVFNSLKNRLLNSGTAFFLLLNKLDNEDLIIGLEMGIDNFILNPVDEISLLNKIHNQIKKTEEINVFEAQKFKDFFQVSPVAMFVAVDHQIIETNNAFCKLFDIQSVKRKKIPFHEFFDLNNKSLNRINLRKLEAGLVQYCVLQNVKSCGNPGLTCTILKFSSNAESGKTIGKVIPVQQNSNFVVQQDFTCPQNGICLKMLNYIDKEEINGIKLTKRETQIIELSAQGLAIKQIAPKLKLSERTVEKHRSNIIAKTKSHSIIEAILVIQKSQLLEFSKSTKLRFTESK